MKYKLNNNDIKEIKKDDKIENKDILGKGTYGCVIPDILDCSNKDNKNYKKSLENVSKLFTRFNDYENEYINTKYINLIDKNNDYTIKLLFGCSINKDTINNILKDNGVQKNYLNKCKLRSIKKLYQIVYNKNGIIFSNIDFNVEKIIKLSYNLFKGIEFFNNNNFIHLDIKRDNVLYDKKEDKLIFIDFGISINNNNYDKIFNLFNKRYYIDTRNYYPPEFIILSLIENNINIYNYQDINNINLLNDKLYNIIYNTYDEYYIRYLDNYFKNNYMNDLYILLKKYYNIKYNMLKNNNYDDIFKIYITKYSDKIDIFSCGMMIFKKLYKIRTDDDDKYFKEYFNNILKYTLISDPEKRNNASDIIKLYYKHNIIDEKISKSNIKEK